MHHCITLRVRGNFNEQQTLKQTGGLFDFTTAAVVARRAGHAPNHPFSALDEFLPFLSGSKSFPTYPRYWYLTRRKLARVAQSAPSLSVCASGPPASPMTHFLFPPTTRFHATKVKAGPRHSCHLKKRVHSCSNWLPLPSREKENRRRHASCALVAIITAFRILEICREESWQR